MNFPLWPVTRGPQIPLNLKFYFSCVQNRLSLKDIVDYAPYLEYTRDVKLYRAFINSSSHQCP